MMKMWRGLIVSVIMVLLSACGGGGENISQAVKAKYEIKSDVVQLSAIDGIKKIDNSTTFTAPISMGLSEGDIFTYENIAYKISMIATDDTSDTITIFTKKPALDETIENLEIKGSIPFSAPTESSANNFKLNAKVINRRTSKNSAVTFECSMPHNATNITDGFEIGVVCTGESGGASITIVSTVTVKGKTLLDYKKGRSKTENKIGFDVDISVVSTFDNEYNIKIDNDQDPKKLFGRVVPLGSTPVTVSIEYFFLAGVSLEGSVDYKRTDHYTYKRIYDFNFKETNAEQNSNSTNTLEASITLGAHIGLRPMASVGVLGIDIAGLYVDAKVKESINVSGKLSDKTSEICATAKLDFSLQGGYKLIGGDYKLFGHPYIKNLRTDTTEGCAASYKYYFLVPKVSCPARPYYQAYKKSNKTVKNANATIAYTSTNASDGISSELSNQESYERIVQIDKTGIGDKTISKVTWEVVDGDMDLKIESIEDDGSIIMLSATDEKGNNAIVKATIHATDGTTISQETSIVRNSKPVAVPKVYISGNNLVLDASESYDPDGNQIIGYGWFFVDTGKKIVNRSPINKVPLSSLPNIINLRMAVASKNKPVELSEVESVSFDTSFNSELTDAIVGKTLYYHCQDGGDDWIVSMTFNPDGTLSIVGPLGTENSTYRIEGNILYGTKETAEESELLEITDSYIKFKERDDGEIVILYYTRAGAEDSPANECDGSSDEDVEGDPFAITQDMIEGRTFYARYDDNDSVLYVRFDFDSNYKTVRVIFSDSSGEDESFSWSYDLSDGTIKLDVVDSNEYVWWGLESKADQSWRLTLYIDENKDGTVDETINDVWYFSKPSDFPSQL